MNRVRTEGRLELEFSPAQDGQTALKVLRQEAPLQVVRAFNVAGGTALVHLHNVSGGVLAGDRLHTAVKVLPGARAQLTTTGATRVYKSGLAGEESRQSLEVQVGEGAWLDYLPDALIPFAGASYHQSTRITLSPGAGLLWWDLIAAGRVARGELFEYERLSLELQIRAGTQPLVLERARLEPARHSLRSSARLAHYNYLVTFYACLVGLPPATWLQLEQELAPWLERLTVPAQTRWGASTLAAHGIIIRGLSRSGRELLPALFELWAWLRPRLSGQSCPPPRKLY